MDGAVVVVESGTIETPAAMLTRAHGDILKADAEALVNTVNCVGFMGRGIAAQFKRAFPKNFAAYELACKHGEVRPGKMLVVPTGELVGPRWIINFPTKRHWRGKSRLEDIESGLVALVDEIRRRDRLHAEGRASAVCGDYRSRNSAVSQHEAVVEDGIGRRR